MAIFPPAFLDELRARLSLVSVVGRRVRLTRKGREHGGLCPFHNEKSPSFTVNEDKGFFHCFGCGAHGDVIGFEMRSGHLSFPEAVERLAAEAGLDVPQASPQERERERRSATFLDVLETTCSFYQEQLLRPAGAQALGYLRKRGLSEQTIARFRLGYAPDNRTALANALKAAQIPEDLAVESGALGRSERGIYDRFHGRVIFPITDRRGRVIAFGGRSLGDEQPKYLNSPETPLFSKGNTLYGLAQAREAAGKINRVLVCEGYMDVIALHQAGFTDAVAPLGTALTEPQIELLWKLAEEPILCLDGDAAGQRAAARAAERALPLLRPGVSLRFALLPAPEDPDSLIKAQGPGAMRAVLDAALPLSELLWRLALASHPVDTPERRASFEHDLLEQAGRIGDETVRHHYRQLFRDRLREQFRSPAAGPSRGGASAGGGRGPAGRFGGPGQGAGGRGTGFRRGGLPPLRADRSFDGRLIGAGPPPPPPDPTESREALLLQVALNHPLLLDEVADSLGRISFVNRDLDKLRQEILMQHPGWHGLDFLAIQNHLRQRGFDDQISVLAEVTRRIPASFARPEADLETARAGWQHLYKLYMRKELEEDASLAEQDAAAAMTQDRFDRLVALTARRQRGG